MLKQIIHSPNIDPIDVESLSTLANDVCQGKNIGAMPWATLPQKTDDLISIKAHAEIFRENCDHVVLCGTGGSSLGARTLVDMIAHPLGLARKGIPLMHIVESTDPETMKAVVDDLPAKLTGWIFISKSGTTLETLTQFLVFLEHRRIKGSGPVLVITMPGSRTIRNLAEKHDIEVLEHDPELGGRFSLLSLVGLLPAAISGLDIRALRSGAASMLQQDRINISIQAACWQMSCLRGGYNTQVIMPYAKRLASWTFWYRQPWAESLGKEGKGSTPLAALGPVDHHSMLQLFLDGPSDKCLSAVCIEGSPYQSKLSLPEDMVGHDYLKGHNGQEILNAQAFGTIQSFLNHGIPVREIRLDKIDETSLGELLMLGMLETVFTAKLLCVNPFDQPAVEESKQIAFQQLKSLQSPAIN